MTTVPSTRVRMGEITGDEARALYPSNPVVLLPLGSQEDQGPHAPMGDYLLAERMAELIALRATAEGTRTVVAPVLPFGKGDFFAPMAGGIALSAATFRAVLDEVFHELLRHNLTRLVVLNGHGGNVEVINDATRAVLRERGLVIPTLYLWRIAGAELPKLVGAEKAKASAGHGADPLTSLCLHLFPERVRTDLIRPPRAEGATALGLPARGFGALDFRGAEVTVPQQYDVFCPESVGAADARLCSAATGKLIADRLVEIGSAFCHHFAKAENRV
ncbi:creatininase family protein [Falsiroseomonas oryziterrae]|uniref:creatininase family protein n=1 Tax=Falsiroseomonas oryziterrae TaxID=2911368 RepID=UPI001F29C8F8|nr:creatininase family protein [Roseomonas sp. NPKOSM-4]